MENHPPVFRGQPYAARVCSSVCSIVKRVRRGINMRDVCACARVFDKRAISHHHRLLVMIYLPIGGPQFLPRIFDEYRNVAAIFVPIFLIFLRIGFGPYLLSIRANNAMLALVMNFYF